MYKLLNSGTEHMFDEISHINPDLIKDQYSKRIVILSLNVIEHQEKQIKELKEMVQNLKDEISRLKGEQGKPKFTPKHSQKDIPSEKKAKQNKGHKKRGK